MAYVGYTGVANQAQTTPGCALGVVADANNGYGDDVGGAGVVDTYSCLVPPTPVVNYYILMENSGYVLQEDGSKIYLEVQ
jgi:hypothetical protein